MSEYSEGTYDVYDERERKARVEHRCDACGETIRVGDKYMRVACIVESEVSTVVRCLRCQTIHKHLREKCWEMAREHGDQMWPRERLDCGLEYREEWDRDPPEDIAALAFALPDEMQRGGT